MSKEKGFWLVRGWRKSRTWYVYGPSLLVQLTAEKLKTREGVMQRSGLYFFDAAASFIESELIHSFILDQQGIARSLCLRGGNRVGRVGHQDCPQLLALHTNKTRLPDDLLASLAMK